MQGMFFVILSDKGIVNNGFIEEVISPEKYLCTFLKEPASSRVISIEELQTYNLFRSQVMMEKFVNAVIPQPAKEPDEDS